MMLGEAVPPCQVAWLRTYRRFTFLRLLPVLRFQSPRPGCRIQGPEVTVQDAGVEVLARDGQLAIDDIAAGVLRPAPGHAGIVSPEILPRGRQPLPCDRRYRRAM